MCIEKFGVNVNDEVQVGFGPNGRAHCEECGTLVPLAETMTIIYKGHRDEGVMSYDILALVEVVPCPECGALVGEFSAQCA